MVTEEPWTRKTRRPIVTGKRVENVVETYVMLSVSVLGRIIFGGYDKTAAFARTSVHSFYDVDEFLLVLNGPVYFVVVTRSQVNHYVFVSVEEHDSAWIIELVHFVEVRNLKEKMR